MNLRHLIPSLALAAGMGCGPFDPGAIDAGSDAGIGGAGGAAGDSGVTNVRTIVSLSLTPTSLNLRVGQLSGLTATATFDDGTSADVSGSVTWEVDAPTVVEVSVLSAADGLVKVEALKVGTATIVAKTGTIASNACVASVRALSTADAGTDGGQPPLSNQEVRAVWVTRFAYNTQAQALAIIDKAAAAGFNVVYFQIRGTGDAYYASALAPWAKKLSGTLGKNPGWDPLQTVIDRAHQKGMQLHAYWNVFSAWTVPPGCASTTCTCQPTQGKSDSCTLPEASAAGAPDHFLRTNPSSMAVDMNGKSTDEEYLWFSAGDPAVKAHLVAVATELLKKYDVDGLHLDRVRYPGSQYSFDPGSNAAYAAVPAPKPSREEWQRTQVTQVVSALYAAVKQHRPKAVLSASVWGIYKPLPSCGTSQGYGNYFQDSIGWMKAGVIDAINPMIYWDIGTGCTDWAKLLDGFMAGANGRHVIAGMHALEKSISPPRPDRIAARVAYARKVGAAGTTLFASTYLDAAPTDGGYADTWSYFRSPQGPFREDAGYPDMPWR